ncbi:hypothetical protein MAR_003658 [Mya arenaria]|uniref:Uncharacterized protein n=1 Tax=Mya arenaria TaxID=6604 RepID=A0ABY7G7I6_MYAAR|nr:hypothetical protein MAR_003658 [Mya arenaria]
MALKYNPVQHSSILTLARENIAAIKEKITITCIQHYVIKQCEIRLVDWYQAKNKGPVSLGDQNVTKYNL